MTAHANGLEIVDQTPLLPPFTRQKGPG